MFNAIFLTLTIALAVFWRYQAKSERRRRWELEEKLAKLQSATTKAAGGAPSTSGNFFKVASICDNCPNALDDCYPQPDNSCDIRPKSTV